MPGVCQLPFSEAMTHQHPSGGIGGLLVTGKCWWTTGTKASPQSRPLQNMSPKCIATLISGVVYPPQLYMGERRATPRAIRDVHTGSEE